MPDIARAEPPRAARDVRRPRTGRRLGRRAPAGGLALVLAALAIATGAPPAAAQLGRKSWEFFPHIGVFFPGDPDALKDEAGFQGFDPGTLWGIYMTYHYSDYVGVEMGFSKATSNHDDAQVEIDGALTPIGDVGMDFWELNGFLNSGALRRFQLFATAGGGLVNYDPENGDGVTRLLLDGGVGFRYYAWKNIALRVEVKDFFFPGAKLADFTGTPECSIEGCGAIGPGPEDDVNNLGAFAGLTFNF
jgi:outer membrane beta-barrel protein